MFWINQHTTCVHLSHEIRDLVDVSKQLFEVHLRRWDLIGIVKHFLYTEESIIYVLYTDNIKYTPINIIMYFGTSYMNAG